MGRRAGVPVWLLTVALVGGGHVGHAAQAPRDAQRAESSPPKVPALAPDAALPPSTPAFSPLGPDLVGRILDTQGKPIPGAGIFIDAARPRVGRGYT